MGDAPKQETKTSTMTGGQKREFERTLGLWRRLYNTGQLDIQPYGGKTVADINPMQRQSWGMAGNVGNDSQGYYKDVLAGKYLTQDAPGMQNIASMVQNRLNANAELAGRYGSGSHDQSVANGLSQVYYDNYARERALQDAAAGGLFNIDVTRQGLVGEAGDQQRAISQQRLDARRALYDARQMAPINALQLYQGGVTAQNAGGTTTTSGGAPLWAQLGGTGLQAAGTAAGGK